MSINKNKRHHPKASFGLQNGMTLLEVLVATGILAVISGMAFLSLDTLVRAKQSLQQVTDEVNQFNLVQFQIQSDIQMAISSNQFATGLTSPEFIGDSQTITLLRYRNATVPNQRSKFVDGRLTPLNVSNQNLIRVRWYVRKDQWFRATQSAAFPLNSNQWQERPMIDIKLLSCSYQNVAGLMQSTWPNNQIQNAQLPEVVNCQIQMPDGQESLLKLVPWQRAGWL